MSKFVTLLVLFVVGRLAINLQESVKLYNLTVSNKVLVGGADADGYGSLLNLSLRHLAGSRTLPDEVVESALLGSTLDCGVAHVCRTDGFVRFLGTLRVGVEVA